MINQNDNEHEHFVSSSLIQRDYNKRRDYCPCGAIRECHANGVEIITGEWHIEKGKLAITRRIGERVHIGGMVLELVSSQNGTAKFRIIEPAHTFYLDTGASIKLFGAVILCLIDAFPSRCKIRITAPKDVKILREELT